MITLPKNPDRVQLYSFIISFGLLITIIGSIFGWYILGIFFEIIVSGVLLTIMLVTIEFIRRNSTLPLYSIWNSLTKIYSITLHRWINNVCFYMIITSVGFVGKDKRFVGDTRRNKSMWRSRSTLNKGAYNSQYNENNDKTNDSGKSIRNYIRWSISTRDKWILCLLPFLVLLKIHNVQEEKKFPANIYTLY
jgi:hypothetical protein